MAYLHSDREQFRDAIDLAYEQTGVMVQAIEKDYYVTMLLRLLAQRMPYIVFKGGTSLSKCHKVIRRFSEDKPQTAPRRIRGCVCSLCAALGCGLLVTTALSF